MSDYEVDFELGSQTEITATLTFDNVVQPYHNILQNRDLPDQHPISAITGLEEALIRADTFVYEQGVASSEWEINHNLNKYPSVTVVDSAGNEVIAEVNYTSMNTCVVTMTAAFKGKAYLN